MIDANAIFGKFNSDIAWIKDKAALIVRYGSRAYGTNVPSSDEDFKGLAIPPIEYFLGSQKRFEQAELKEPDTVIYEIRKFFNLAAAANPSILEVLFVDPSDHILVSPVGRTILDNRDLFLSKRVKHTYSGYAISQLKRIKLHRRHILNPPKAPPTRKEMGLPEHTLIPADQLMAVSAEIQKQLDRMNFDFMEELSEPVKIAVRNTMSEMLAELKITSDDQWMGTARKIGLTENFIELMQKERAYLGKKREWDQYQDWKRTRNKERYAMEEKFGVDLKHAYHLVRLMRMAREILETGKVIVKRPDREELLAIRNGAWTYEQIVSFAEKEDQALQKVYEDCTILPKIPDLEAIDALCIRLVEQSLEKR
jgi:predicted nucleotidyltransferase